MSEHSPQYHQNPDHPLGPDLSGTDPTLTDTALSDTAPSDTAPSDTALTDTTLIDTVPGDMPVPITVWRTARTSADTLHTVGARLAYRLVSAYSRPGDAVVDLSDGHALTAACQNGRRRHHPGWFTDASSLIIGPATPTGVLDTDTDAGDHCDGAGDVEPPELAAWFGDDLADPAPGADDMGSVSLEPPTGDAGVQANTSLVVATWPLHDGQATNRVRLAWLLTACTRLLRPGGCLVLVLAAADNAVATPEDFSPVSAAAARVGLGYLQHIVAVDADAGAEAFVYHVTDEELLGLAADSGGQQWTVAHLRVHADLLVFSQIQTRPTGRHQSGGEHRG